MAAVRAKEIILPAVVELQKIDSAALAGNSYTAKTISRAVSALQMHLKDADKLFAQVETNFQSAGGNELLGQVARRMSAITGEINLIWRTMELLRQAHDHKVNSLRNDGFTQAQIDQIEPDPQQQLADHAAAIKALQAEQEKLHAFVATAPAYELHHLAGTSFEGGLNQLEVA
ncbi:hypothetical protein [Methylomonas sp. Kb3]|uniref:hypothetical protein n=1 Tax=Methylomonas sp. Kb3 TaxID=1611544 RepID=UPI0010565A99|nr:hypothetical protein [Methylomonas sp. Kb3]